jgi:sarcosine oxidase subunit beta
VLLERDALASGSTSKAAGGIRAQFADELNVRIALRSLEEFEAMAEEISFRQYGYLFLLDNMDDVATFREALALQQSLGVPSRELTAEEARAIVPQLEIDDLLCATFCERDGYATPESVVQRYAREPTASSAVPESGRARSARSPASHCRSRARRVRCGSRRRTAACRSGCR